MDTHADSFGISWDNAKSQADKKLKRGENWFNAETSNLENLISQGTQDAKAKLLQLAEKYNVKNVTEQMGVNEIKNKIKAKLRGMK